jgi:glycosyltransferase involved in cell wall biosynthesis
MNTKNMKPKVALVMIVKNEEDRICVTLKSFVGHVEKVFIYDTGSTDTTVQKIKEFCEKNQMDLHLKEGEFVNFSYARNIAMNMVEEHTDIDFMFLADSNDELVNGRKLSGYLSSITDDIEGIMICQELENVNAKDQFFNIKIIRPRRGWYYRGSVHEWVSCPDGKERKTCALSNDVRLYQRRDLDIGKSIKRFPKDKELLLKDIENNPSETRAYFYLAQTCVGLGEKKEAFEYYKKRASLSDGFWEEVYHSYVFMGDIGGELGMEWPERMKWYMQAFETCKRVEPLISIIKYYREQKDLFMAYQFAHMACNLPYPSACLLFVDKIAYDYMRWHLLSIVAYYIGKVEEGKKACETAFKDKKQDIDKNNLKLYLEKERELKKGKKKGK